MPWQACVLLTWYVWNIVFAVWTIGKPRKAITHGEALMACLIFVFLGYCVWGLV